MTEWISAELEAGHDVASFDCGKEILDKWHLVALARDQFVTYVRTEICPVRVVRDTSL